ncbi:MAG: superoxide dismutase [Defluviitaleaceae bacterium]|nr:superoxide dismutase [Defluviitaleaceae bacterium]
MTYPFVNQPLPYPLDAMEPHIDTQTMYLHHNKHLQTYVDNLNSTLKNYPEYQSWTLEQLLHDLEALPQVLQTPVRNNAGGVYNHTLYFNSLTPANAPKPLKDGALKTAITASWGSLDAFLADFKTAALSVFGSGYTYLVSDTAGALSIFKTPNQDTPIPKNLKPILILDVWEHAYYLLRQNRRADYIDNYFPLINWDTASKIYACNT